jgi:hypothetical protein
MKLKFPLVLSLLAVLHAVPAAAWSINDANGRSVLKIHTEYKNGAPWTVAYYVSATEVVSLSNLGSADAQAMKKILDDAFTTGKKITWMRNNSRGAPRVGGWYDVNDNNATITFYDYAGGEEFLLRVK